LSTATQEIHKAVGRFPKIANAVGAGQTGGMKQNATGARKSIAIPLARSQTAELVLPRNAPLDIACHGFPMWDTPDPACAQLGLGINTSGITLDVLHLLKARSPKISLC
jgi:hypothetical protein